MDSLSHPNQSDQKQANSERSSSSSFHTRCETKTGPSNRDRNPTKRKQCDDLPTCQHGRRFLVSYEVIDYIYNALC